LAKKPPVSPEAAAQAEKMKARLEELAAKRKEQEAEKAKGRRAGGGWAPGGVDARQTRSGRRGNR
jgi:hypothetical protein